MDPLSQVLALLKPQSNVSAGFDAGGDWSIAFDHNAGIKCYSVVTGQCWLSVQDVAARVHLKAGDSFLLPGGRPFRLASDLALPSINAATIFPPQRAGGVVTHNGGGDFFLVGSRFALSGNHAGVLLNMLPPVVHIHSKADQAALRWLVERMMRELRDGKPGGALVAQHLAHMMLVEALRLHMADGLNAGVGWLFALADKQIGAAITAMHDEPSRGWTLQQLAERACMSRSSFAARFKQTVGSPAMDYLIRWRMMLAADRLENTGASVASIALSLGYESESAFSTAFKRVMGASPRRYGVRREETAADGAGQE